MRRGSPLKASRGTVWPTAVREHVRTHHAGCIGPESGMDGLCAGAVDLDHIRASHGIGMKSDSIATNAAPLCFEHHKLKTEAGKTWRPRLIDTVSKLTRGCVECEEEAAAYYGLYPVPS